MQQRCKRCGKSKDIKEYQRAGYTAGGDIRYKSECKACVATVRNKTANEDRKKQIYEWEAPLSAAVLLMKEHPEALADLVRRWQVLYRPLLDAERKRMLKLAS